MKLMTLFELYTPSASQRPTNKLYDQQLWAITLYTTAVARQSLQQSRFQDWKNRGKVLSGSPYREVMSEKTY
jgi:hypothetical protein